MKYRSPQIGRLIRISMAAVVVLALAGVGLTGSPSAQAAPVAQVNSSASRPPACPPTTFHDDFNFNFFEYAGGWTHSSAFIGPKSGTISWTKTGTATFWHCRGDFRYWYTKAHNRGIVEIRAVTLWGIFTTIVDAYSPTVQWQASVPISSPASPGCCFFVEIRPTGTKNPAATDTYIDIDGITLD